jgi:ubiquinone/menaquinone biosynthesis C-methylase UbiE
MTDIWSKPLSDTNPARLNYWEYFGVKLVERAAIDPGAKILDIGCGTGSSLFPAGEKTGSSGYATGIDICPG